MARTQSELFQHATQIAEGNIRQARAMQSRETKDMIKRSLGALLAKVRRSHKSAPQKARAQSV